MLKLLHLIFAFGIVIPVLLLSVFVAIIPVAIMRLFKAERAADRWARINGTMIATISVWTLNVKMHVDGLEHIPADGTPLCFVANHQSLLDIPAVVSGLGIWAGFITKKELKKVPLLHFWIESINCVYIDRKSPRSSIEAIIKGVDNIRKGIPMFIFPEGTRSKTGALGEFKVGSLKLATRAKALVVPIAICGTRKAFEEKKGLGRVHVRISVCEPIPTAALTEEEIKLLPAKVFGAVESKYNDLMKSQV
ncbi:MAG: 1-acyl-sn-glycerol-3-phosphate acyltransferase [Spirochaetae bacterium HGW-Spirochaetae-8]|nr:MAG: 1-acyl-sn-glycerol-3-phosphate acyltransferase [Spirochaetae bacterium HGW-Spirochaetae-8]